MLKKLLLHTTPPKKSTAVSQLPALYRQQLKLTAAKHVVTDPRVQKALDQKQAMMGRRIAKLQVDEKK